VSNAERQICVRTFVRFASEATEAGTESSFGGTETVIYFGGG
jgi:hypothetical protein